MKPAVIALIIVLLVSCGLFFWSQGGTKSATTDSASASTKTNYEKLPQANMDMDDSTSSGMNMDNGQLTMKVVFGNDGVSITNTQTSWSTCSFTLNEGMIQKGFTTEEKNFNASQTITLPYTVFTENGKVFNTTERKPNNLSIMCQNPQTSGWQFVSNR